MEKVFIQLTFKQKKFIYEIARLEYRIWNAITKLEIVNNLIVEEEGNIISINAAIRAAGKGKIAEKLSIWKTKSEYKLFKLNLRKNKIDVVKIVLNQSKLEQTKNALISIEKSLSNFHQNHINNNIAKEEPPILNMQTKPFQPDQEKFVNSIESNPKVISSFSEKILKIAS